MRITAVIIAYLAFLSGAGASVIKSVEYLIDHNRELPLDSVLYGGRKDAFLTASGTDLNFGFLDAAIWLKITPSDEFSGLIEAVLEIKNPNLDLIMLSLVRGREVYHMKPAGDQFPYRMREIGHRYHQFSFPEDMQDLGYIYIYIDNIGDQLFIPIELGSKVEIDKRDYFLQYFNGIYFGILIFVFLLNLFLYFSLKERSNFYYLFYILGLFILQLSLEGYGYEFLWPDSIYLANHANPICATFSILALLMFCREFLSLRSNLPGIDRVMRFLSYFLIILFFLAMPNLKWMYKFSILSINSLALLLNIVIIPIAIYLWRKGYKAARFFTTAFVILVITVFIFILRNFGAIPNNFFVEKSLQFGSATEVILLSLAIVDKFRLFKDQAYDRLVEINDMKSRANVELERKVSERTRELREQKEIVEVKNREITESIEYARRIQNGLLPSSKLFSSLYPKAFVLYLPKDIVSGDFYWIDQVGKRKYFAAVDCTGHGVPGAMVSVMGFNHLNRCLNEHNLHRPGEILDKLTSLMAGSFRKSELTIYDGMDIALCCLDEESMTLEYAGANNPIYLVSGGVLIEYKATKQAIGYSEEVKPFINEAIPVKKGDWIYVFSDGFADQFGGPKNKKFRYKDFKLLLESIHALSPAEQSAKLQNSFREWKGKGEQLDDVCVMGVCV